MKETAMNQKSLSHPSYARWLMLRLLPLLIAAVGFASATPQAWAQPLTDPPARVGTLSQIEGSVVFAPAGETEWLDAVPNRPITRGDRLWTDRGARAQVHVGSAALHMDHQTFLEVSALDADVLQASLNEGSLNARVRDVQRGENFEIDTPQLAFRATQPGDYRIDVDPAQGTTRVTVRTGSALVYGASGQAQELQDGQVVTFTGRDLQRVAVRATPSNDDFDRWAAALNRAEDQSVTARYVPRDVVGYQQLDAAGTWSQDASYGAVWYPRVTIADWAPYRYGHWDYIAPWGWTWVDDAPWGFAPFHYGRWAMIGSRWAWVPGRIGPRPVYSPALVAFVGSGGVNFSFSFGSGIGWFPLGPGEFWRPAYRTSPRYVTSVNRYIVVRDTNNQYMHRQRPGAWTSVRAEDFARGRPVRDSWQRVRQADVERAPIGAQITLPQPSTNRFVDPGRAQRARQLPAPQLAGPGSAGRAPVIQERREDRQQARQERQQERQERQQERQQERASDPQRDRQVQQQQAQQEIQQRRQQQVEQQVQQNQQNQRAAREQERAEREQQRAQREQQQMQRQQEDQRRQQQVQREQAQRDQAMRQQQAAQENQARQQQAQERAMRQQQQEQERAMRQQQAQQERAARQQQQEQERVVRQQAQEQQRAMRQAPQVQPQAAQPEARQRGGEGRGEGRGRGRDDARDEEGGRGNGRGGRS